MARSLGFGSNSTYYVALFRLAFATPPPNGLSLHAKLTRGPIIQKVRRHTARVLRLLVGIWFQVYFTPLIGVLFTFPSRYLFTIGRSGVFSLRGWSPYVQTGFHVSRLTRRHSCFLPVQDYHLLWCDFPDTSSSYNYAIGLVRVRSPLLTESRLISFPPGTEMFHFPGFASCTYVFSTGYRNKAVGFPIRTFTGQRLLTARRDFSQSSTSFIASDRQGIHQMPFLTLEFKPRTEINPHKTKITLIVSRNLIFVLSI